MVWFATQSDSCTLSCFYLYKLAIWGFGIVALCRGGQELESVAMCGQHLAQTTNHVTIGSKVSLREKRL